MAKEYPQWVRDFNWCVDNGWQVYLVPIHLGRYKIGIMKNGIFTNGKKYAYRNGVKITAVETIGKKEFVDAYAASEYMKFVYNQLRKTYG